MHFRLVSDVHLEFILRGSYSKFDVETHMKLALPPSPHDKDSTLILAGDISQHHPQRKMMLDAVASRFRTVVYVSGNHEHYGNRMDLWNDEARIREAEYENVYIGAVGDAGFIPPQGWPGDLAIIYATMWAPYGKYDKTRAEDLKFSTDCKYIQQGSAQRRSTPEDFQAVYTAELAAIRRNLLEAQKCGYTSAVVTHHVPSLLLRHPKFPEDSSDDMFMAPEAEAFMHEDWAPKFWFFGHTHKAHDRQIGNTRCISNPYGYPGESYQGWVSSKVV